MQIADKACAVKTYTFTGYGAISTYTATIYKLGQFCILPLFANMSRNPTSTDVLNGKNYAIGSFPSECKPITATIQMLQSNSKGNPIDIVNATIQTECVISAVCKASYQSTYTLRGTLFWVSEN